MEIKVGLTHEAHNRAVAVEYLKTVLTTARDWQDGQHALADHPTIGPWMRATYGAECISGAQSLIREAEEQLGNQLGY